MRATAFLMFVRLREGRLRQEQIDAVGEVVVVDARVVLEGPAVLGQPQFAGEVVLEDLVSRSGFRARVS